MTFQELADAAERARDWPTLRAMRSYALQNRLHFAEARDTLQTVHTLASQSTPWRLLDDIMRGHMACADYVSNILAKHGNN